MEVTLITTANQRGCVSLLVVQKRDFRLDLDFVLLQTFWKDVFYEFSLFFHRYSQTLLETIRTHNWASHSIQ